MRRLMLAAMLAGLLVSWAAVVGRAAAAQAPGGPGPGLGDSTSPPGGRPVDLRLPPGYTLIAIRGGAGKDDAECVDAGSRGARPAECPLAAGVFPLTIMLQFDPAAYVAGKNTNEDSCGQPQESDDEREKGKQWAGWVLAASGGEAQNVLVPIDVCTTTEHTATPVITLPPPPPGALTGQEVTTVEVTLSGYCLNLARDIPDEQHGFDVGAITNDPSLLRILDAIDGKRLADFEGVFAVQNVIWEYTDGDGLTQELLDEIAALE